MAAANACEGWTVADVVLHLAQTDELALASANGWFPAELNVLAGGVDGGGNVDDGAAAMVGRLPTGDTDGGVGGPLANGRCGTA